MQANARLHPIFRLGADTAQSDRQRIHRQFDAFDGVGGDVVFAHQIKAAVDTRVDDDAARIGFVGVGEDFVAGPEPLRHCRFEPPAFRYIFLSPAVLLRIDFTADDEAIAFASEFDGRVIATSGG
jgi:hypothetical protein